MISFETEEQYYVLTDKGREFLNIYKDYSKDNRQLEKRLNEINGKKKILEELCSIK